MGHSYEKSKKIALSTILILAAITIFEVLFALTGKGHMFGGKLMMPGYVIALVMIVLSLTKAYLIVYEFMHMKYEVPGLVRSVLLPTLLLIWAIIAFFYEGSDWQNRRDLILQKNNEKVQTRQLDQQSEQTGMVKELKKEETH
ncbi:MAG: cytochrome C oxidase subunit IV family protein [Saprospiraceae bacterium]|jgi:cytochrome c oxidase subunit 4